MEFMILAIEWDSKLYLDLKWNNFGAEWQFWNVYIDLKSIYFIMIGFRTIYYLKPALF